MKETVLFDGVLVVIWKIGIRIRIHSKVVTGVEEDEEQSVHIYSKRS